MPRRITRQAAGPLTGRPAGQHTQRATGAAARRDQAARGPGRGDAGGRRCCFPEALGSRVAGCSRARKAARQYRRMVYCTDPEAHGRCAAWLDHLRHATRFSFGAHQTPGALPRRAAGRLQCGGLLGAAELLEGRPVNQVDDVAALLRRLDRRYPSVKDVPLQGVVQRIQELDRDDD